MLRLVSEQDMRHYKMLLQAGTFYIMLPRILFDTLICAQEHPCLFAQAFVLYDYKLSGRHLVRRAKN